MLQIISTMLTKAKTSLLHCSNVIVIIFIITVIILVKLFGTV